MFETRFSKLDFRTSFRKSGELSRLEFTWTNGRAYDVAAYILGSTEEVPRCNGLHNFPGLRKHGAYRYIALLL